MTSSTRWWVGGAVAAAAVAGVVYFSGKASAADLGSCGCGDLEERIAELESSVARKGNRKVTLRVSGEVSKALFWHDIDGLPGADKFRVIDNPNSGTKLRFSGDAKMSATMKAGFLVEIGLDETAGAMADPVSGALGLSADDFKIRHSVVWMETPVGKVSVGRTSTATDGIAEIDLSNTNIASLPMSVEPLWTYSGLGNIKAGTPSVTIGSLLNPTGFDGGRLNIVRYDTPTLGGFQASAAWGGGQSVSGDDVWDAALRYAGEFGGLRVAAGIGYRNEKFDNFAPVETKTLAGSATVMHVPSGLFVAGYAGQQDDHILFGDVQMWQVRGGIAKNFFGIGQTSVFAEYADHKLKTFDVDSTMIGGGIVQSLDAAALDLFVSYRAYDIGGGFDAATGLAGARIKF